MCRWRWYPTGLAVTRIYFCRAGWSRVGGNYPTPTVIAPPTQLLRCPLFLFNLRCAELSNPTFVSLCVTKVNFVTAGHKVSSASRKLILRPTGRKIGHPSKKKRRGAKEKLGVACSLANCKFGLYWFRFVGFICLAHLGAGLCLTGLISLYVE